ncbi:MAG: hypothetical protein H6657_05040 [Ardenticatenaceae bacterium]|nr:hypothetical protein [Ardenticatenaceae bacterium]
MKYKLTLLVLLLLALVACTPSGGDEPAASDDPTAETPTETPDMDAPVSSDDPTTTPSEGKPDAAENITIGDAMVEAIDVMIMESFPVQVSVHVTGYLGDGCTTLGDITTKQDGETFSVHIYTERPTDMMCTQQLVGFEENVTLDVAGLPAGAYTVDVNGTTSSFTLDMDNSPQLPGSEDGSLSDLGLPNEDLTELLRLTLVRALVDQEIPDYALLADQGQIVLSTENIDPALLPELDGVDLVTMTPEEIQAKADADGDFPYLRFQGFTAVSTDEVNVSLGSTWAIGTDSDMLYLSGGGFTIHYTRTSDGWTGEVTESWIS